MRRNDVDIGFGFGAGNPDRGTTKKSGHISGVPAGSGRSAARSAPKDIAAGHVAMRAVAPAAGAAFA